MCTVAKLSDVKVVFDVWLQRHRVEKFKRIEQKEMLLI